MDVRSVLTPLWEAGDGGRNRALVATLCSQKLGGYGNDRLGGPLQRWQTQTESTVPCLLKARMRVWGCGHHKEKM